MYTSEVIVYCHGDSSVGIPGIQIKMDIGISLSDENEWIFVKETLERCFSEIWDEPAFACKVE